MATRVLPAGNTVTVTEREEDILTPGLVQPRGADSDDSSSTQSLEEQEFADMERLMEQLDDAVLEAPSTSGGGGGGGTAESGLS